MFKHDYKKELDSIALSDEFKKETIRLLLEKSQNTPSAPESKPIIFPRKAVRNIVAACFVVIIALFGKVYIDYNFGQESAAVAEHETEKVTGQSANEKADTDSDTLVAEGTLRKESGYDVYNGSYTLQTEKAVMVNDIIYYDSGQKVSFIRCGVMDGDITSSVESNQLPDKNGQSNFGTGYSWQLIDEHHIDIPFGEEGGWHRFCDRKCDSDHSLDLSGTETYPGHTIMVDDEDNEVYYYNNGEGVYFYDGNE